MKKSIKNKLLLLLMGLCLLFSLPSNAFALTNANDTSKDAPIPSSQNKYPIIMVHGLYGWGNDELFGTNYWGGSQDLKKTLTVQGYTVFTPTIGSLSSNWDRACELYAYIKGGTADYGEAHSKKHGHARYGRTYPGIYPDFGKSSNAGDIQKIHLIGHSMGGQTVRTFAQLLENGDAEEIATTPASNISPLFQGNKPWICSITSIATPHDGSSVANLKYKGEPFTQQFYGALAAETGILDSTNPCFDFRLDQWGLHKEKDESFRSYLDRVVKSNIWKTSKDLSVWDLSPEGARELNSWVKAQKDIYYFSIACEDTHKDLLTKHEVPNTDMSPILIPYSTFIGCYTNSKSGEVPIDNTWWKNDGIVSLNSAICPKVGSQDKMIPYNGTAQKGTWNFLGTVSSCDHLKIVQKSVECYSKTYLDLAKMLSNLPK